MAGSRRVTIKQIAREAGVSKQTVSRVLNDRPDVATTTRQRVQSIIDRYGYRPSKLARGLTQGRSYTIGVISSGLPHYGPSQILTGIADQAHCMGYTLSLSLLNSPDQLATAAVFQSVLAQHVDGIILASANDIAQDLKIQQELADTPMAVIANIARPEMDISTFEFDNLTGGRLATQHLLDQGYRTVAIMTGVLSEWSAQQRLQGWREALEGAQLAPDEDLIAKGDWTTNSGAEKLELLLRRRPDIDALFACNDQMALGALKAAQEMGRRVPQDLGIVGFDDIPEASYFSPPLTTVRQNLVLLGQLTVRELDQQINARIQDESYEPQAIVLSPELIVRDSSSIHVYA
jgi:LacI family transcriptional regulator